MNNVYNYLYLYPTYPSYYNGPFYRGSYQPMYMLKANPMGYPISPYSLAYQTLPEDSRITDYGRQPYVVNIEEATKQNNTFRTAIWTGNHLQVTLMSIPVGEDIGLEVHPDTDQFLRIEEGQGLTQMGNRKDKLYFQRYVDDDDAIMIPAGTWHNITNTGDKPLKLYSIYAPPEHPFSTVHQTKADAAAIEEHHYQ
ncbi:cupin domain-containing protein [Virgibacillus pantothenticus]|uniref:cupin domain-containing protein n=1 Tax=Virgibacillus pantothenticus TaxID=1473 RepID=UPI003D186050